MTAEIYKIPEGRLIINHSDSSFSEGVLELNSHQKLKIHNRPIIEELTQLKGECVVTTFFNEIAEEYLLQEGDSMVIAANLYHIHANESDEESSTLWRFDGDISDTLKNIRESFKKL